MDLRAPGQSEELPEEARRRPSLGRLAAAALALGSLAANLVLMLSDRAPGVLGRLPERIETSDRNVSRAVAEVPLPESDTEIHVLVWALTMVLVGLATWSWRSLAWGAAAVLAISTLVELAQDHLTATRNTQFGDVVANAVGVALGVAVVAAWKVLWPRLRSAARRS